MESLKEMWLLVCDQLRSSLNDIIYNTWFAQLEIVDFDGVNVQLAVSEFKRGIIEKQFSQQLNDAFKTVLGFDVNIIMVDPEEKSKVEEKIISQQTAADSDNQTFETFVVGASNRFAYTAALSVAEEPFVKYNPLFIWGSSGLGKTHLLCAIKNAILARNPNANVIMTRGEDFVNLVIEGIRIKNNMDEVRRKFRNCDVLLVDDIQFIAGKDSIQEEFFHTFNALTAEGKQIVLVSDTTPKDIPGLTERLRARFEQGLIADIGQPDYSTRLAIIQKKADYLNLDLPNDVAGIIAEKVKTNIRQLEGVVMKLHALVNLNSSTVSVPLALTVIKDIASEGLPVEELVNKLIKETARTYGVSVEDIISKKKDAKTTKARQAAIYCVRETTELTQQEISEYFGGRDRTAIHYSYEKMLKIVEKDPSTKKTIENIIKNAKEQ